MNLKIRVLAEVSMAVAMALVLSQLRLFQMPAGGSVSLGMVPLLVVALRWGGLAGLLAGVVFGALRLFLGASVFHPAQFILDYPVAYGMMGLAGVLSENRVLGIITAGAGRLLMHVLSGVIFFSGALTGIAAWHASLAYNVTYLIPEVFLVTLVTLPLMARLPSLGERHTASSPSREKG